MYLYMASVADVDLIKGSQLVCSAKTLTDSSLSISVNNEEIRGGKGGKLYGKYYHTSAMTLSLTDVMFNMDFIAANVGAVKTIGGKTMTIEEVTASTDGQITVTGTPVDFLGKGTIGWYAKAGENDWNAITFVGQVATASGVISGQKYCIKYNVTNNALEQIVVDADIVPDEMTAILKADLFLGEKPNDEASGSKVGYVEITVPRFQPDGALDISMTMTGAATTPLNGSALATFDSALTCSQSGYYAVINKVQSNANWYDGLIALAIEDADVQLDASATSSNIVTYAVYKNAQSTIVDPSNLTYIVSSGANFEMDSTVVNQVKTKSGVSSGDTATVTVTVSGVSLPASITAIQAIADVEYTA